MKLIDTHAHLDSIENIDTALQEAFAIGVEGIIAVSTDMKACQKNYDIYRRSLSVANVPRIYLSMGIHPSDARPDDCEPVSDFIQKHAHEISAIGEIGLDFFYKEARHDEAKKGEQRRVFQFFLQLAKQMDLPAIIHSRGAYREAFETVKELGVKRAVFHWWDGPMDVLEDIMKHGYYVSATPNLAYNDKIREMISHVNVNQLLIETDSPVLYRNTKTHEQFEATPKDVLRTLEAYCQLKNVTPQAASLQFNQNVKGF